MGTKKLTKVEIKIKAKPISINNAFYRNRRYTQEARKYREEFLIQLQSDSNQLAFNKIRKGFDKLKHGLKFKYTFFQPVNKLYTKAGYISRFSVDIDNCLKLPTDFICHKKYNGREYRKTMIKNLNIDDQFIIETGAIKHPSLDNSYYIVVDIEIVPLSK